jgi:hypothetical protein
MGRATPLAQEEGAMITDMIELISFVFSPIIPHLFAALLLFNIVATGKQYLYRRQ